MLYLFIAVCIYRYVITLGLWSKYDVVDHFQICDVNACESMRLCFIWRNFAVHCWRHIAVATYRCCIVCNHLIHLLDNIIALMA